MNEIRDKVYRRNVSSRQTCAHAGFTLIELLIVISIMALIAGLVGPRVIKQFAGAKADTAGLQIADLESALDLFYLDLGRYPTTTEGLKALVSAPSQDIPWRGPYLKKPAIPLDPWGQAYGYRSPGEHGPYDLYSLGADKQPGGERDNEDIASWD